MENSDLKLLDKFVSQYGYEVVRTIEHNYGSVWTGLVSNDGQLKFLKIRNPSPESYLEAQVMSGYPDIFPEIYLDEFPYLVMEYIQGTALWDMSDQEKYQIELGKILKKMHLKMSDQNLGADMATYLKKEIKLDRFSLTIKQVCQQCMKSILPAKNTQLIHGDFWSNNIIISSQKIVVIDPKPFISLPAWDIAHYAGFSNDPHGTLLNLLKGYGSIPDHLDVCYTLALIRSWSGSLIWDFVSHLRPGLQIVIDQIEQGLSPQQLLDNILSNS